ncbi:hypothetical protein PINS_up004717 [Pythium insidiosum]|nr:hypothetical protein PINS_up004717 [Pythium insidiosum]
MEVLCWLQRALVILSHDSYRARDTPESGVSAVLLVLYPYVVQEKREALVRQWRRVVRWVEHDILGSRLTLADVRHRLSASVKCLLLNVSYLQRVLVAADEDDGEEEAEEEGAAVPKLAFIVDRDDVFESSRRALSASWLVGSASNSTPPPYTLYPFFKSSFGEKLVQGERVEEGEGRGPLKEWFSLVLKAATSAWRPVSRDVSESDVVVCLQHNRLTFSSPLSVEHFVRVGFKIEWRDKENVDAVVSRVVNAQTSVQAFVLDRSVGDQELSLRLTDLAVYAPQSALLEYQKSSESWWLQATRGTNAKEDADASERQQRYEFLGAFIANALLHFCAFDVRLHPLLLTLLLDAERSITLDDVRELDTSLFDALQQMRRMKPSELGSVLEFEGLSPSLSVDDYVAHTLESTLARRPACFTQLQAMRRGFQRFYRPSDRQHASVSGRDLSVVLAAGANGSSNRENDDVDIETLFQVSLDPDLAACEPLRHAFWQVVRAFSPALKRKLLKFITGVDTLPQRGTEVRTESLSFSLCGGSLMNCARQFLRIEMPFPSLSAADHARTLLMLPQSHVRTGNVVYSGTRELLGHSLVR